MASEPRRYLIESLGRQILSNLTPAYASLLWFGFLFGLEASDARLGTFFFVATLGAMGLSALQPLVLRVVLRPSDFIRDYAESSAEKILQEFHKKQGRLTEKKKTRRHLASEFALEYGRRLLNEINDFEANRSRMPSQERAPFESSEARLLSYVYLTIIFGGSFAIGLLKLFFPEFLELIFLDPFVIIMVSIPGFLAFFYGSRDQVSVYRRAIWRKIPVMAAMVQGESERDIARKLKVLRKKKKKIKDEITLGVYDETEKDLARKLKQATTLSLEKDLLEEVVAEKSGITLKQVRNISQEFSERAYAGTTWKNTLVAAVSSGVPIATFFIASMFAFRVPIEEFFTFALGEPDTLVFEYTLISAGIFSGIMAAFVLGWMRRFLRFLELKSQ